MTRASDNVFCVTGGGGFVGRQLVQSLSALGFRVRVLTRSQKKVFPAAVEVFQGDLALEGGVPKEFLHGCRYLFHCAGELHNTSIMHAVHVTGTRQLIQAASTNLEYEATPIHWIQLSSVGVYGPPSQYPVEDRIISELDRLSPVGEYETTKAMADQLLQIAGERGLVSYTILRPSNIFGREMTNKSLSGLIDTVKKGRFFYIGKPGAISTYIHVNDVVNALISCALNPAAKDKVFNLSSDCYQENLITVIAQLAGACDPKMRIPELLARLAVILISPFIKIPLTQNRINALISRTRYPSTKIITELGFSYSMPMPESIADMFKRSSSNH